MKIGVLTHHYVKNFGAFLQAYSLINLLEQEYPKAQIEFIDYRVLKHEYINSIHYFGYRPSRGDGLIGYINKIGLYFTHLKYEKSLPKSKRYRSVEGINSANYDLIIVGSDEVWNYNDIAYDPIKFGYGLTSNVITYAVSAGNSKYDDGIYEEIKDGIEAFKAISVRDDITEQLVYDLTYQKAIRVLDPVFLCDFNIQCRKKIKELVAQKEYILIYDCCMSEKQINTLVKYAAGNNMNILGAGEYRKWYSSTSTVNVTPFEWIYLFEHAKAVITGTFHGTSFAIKYNKPFAVFATFQNRISKVRSLLRMFGMENRLVTDPNISLTEIIDANISYNEVNKVIEEMKEQSLDYLFSNINEFSA